MNRAICFLFLFGLLVSFQTGSVNYYALSSDDFLKLPEANQVINAKHPNYALLDAAIFHNTNIARRTHGLPPLQHAAGLQQAAQQFASDMIQMGFYNHVHLYSPSFAKLTQRVETFTREYSRMAENIGQYQLIDSPPEYCCRRKRDGSFEYFNCDNKHLLNVFNYLDFAQYAVDEWMNSPSHRHNVLDSTYTHLGCAARLSKNPYQECRAPFGRFVQNFGKVKTN